MRSRLSISDRDEIFMAFADVFFGPKGSRWEGLPTPNVSGSHL
jgi:hypothetical protein